MKKNLFRKFLALFLTGTMLAGVGCKDYDDDIDSLNNRVDGLETDVVALKTDVTSLKATQEAFNKIDFTSFVTNSALQTKLDDVLKNYAKKSDLKAWLTSDDVLKLLKDKGYMTKTEIETLIGNSVLDADDVKAIFNNMLTGEAIMGKVQTDVQKLIDDALKEAGYMTGESALSDSQVSQIMTALAAAMADETSAVCKAFKSWLGPEMADYLATYITTDEFKAAAGSAANASVLAQLNTANSDLQKKINEMIGAALSGDEENPFLQKSDLAAVQKKYDDAIAVLWGAIGDIAGRIQSLVFVSEYDQNAAVFTGAYLYDGSDDGINLTNGLKGTMTFRVSPASLAQKIADGYNNKEKRTVELAFLPEEVIVTRAADPIVFEIEGDVVAENGKITMLVNTNYEYTDRDKTYAVALQVISKSNAAMPGETEGQEGEKIETGIEYVSDYVSTYGDWNEISDDLVLAKVLDGGFEAYSAPAEYYLVYNNVTTSVELLGDYMITFEDEDGELISLAAAAKKYNWDIVPESEPAIKRADFLTDAVAADLALTPKDPKDDASVAKLVTVGLKKANVANIDKKVTDKGTYSVAVKVEGKTNSVELGDYEAVLNITRKTLGTIDNVDAAINWFYLNEAGDQGYSVADNQYVSTDIFIDTESKVLSKEQFTGIKTSLANATWTIDQETSDADLLAANPDLEVTAAAVSDPYIGTDSKVLKYTVKNYKNGNGTIYVSTKIMVNDNEEVTIKGAITFKGLPNMEYAIDIPNGEMVINEGQNNIWVVVDKDFYATMFAKLPAGQQFFKDQAQFNAFMTDYEMTGTSAPDQEANPAKKIAKAGIRQNNAILRAFFKMNTVDFNAADSYTFTVIDPSYGEVADAAFKINLSGSVTINKANGYYLGQGIQLKTDKEVPYLPAYGKLENNTFKTEIVTLVGAYGKKVPEGSTATVNVTYNLKTTAPAGYTGTMPTIDPATNLLDWKGCQLDAVEVEAVMTVDGLTIDTKVFNVELQKPIDFDAWAKFATWSEEVPVGQAAQVNLYKVMNVKVNKKNVAVDTPFGNNLLTDTGLAANVENADYYGLTITFGEHVYTATNGATTFENFGSTSNGSIITYTESNNPIEGKVTVKVPVTFTYKYALDNKFAPVKFVKEVVVEFTKK